MALNIHNRIEYIIDSERLYISVFERQIGVGKNSIFILCVKIHLFLTRLLKKFTLIFQTTPWAGLFLEMKMNHKLK